MASTTQSPKSFTPQSLHHIDSVAKNRWKRGSVACLVWLLTQQAWSQSSEETARLFAQQVYPTLEQRCFPCHGGGANQLKGGLDLTSRESIIRGGDSATPAIIPGAAEQSPLYQAILGKEPSKAMPPKEQDRLTDPQIEAIAQWIQAGALWIKAPQRALWVAREKLPLKEGMLRIPTSGGLDTSWDMKSYDQTNVWAWLPLQNSVIPETSTLETNHPIDAFLQVKRDEIGITAAPPAPHRVLIRRMFLDLTGLMPTLQELERWEQAMRESPDRSLVVAKLIEVLLASPHYGERWAQHWLDVVRYADTGGMSNDYERSNAWRYRDYVVRAFNADKPYDRFIVEQIAGDELADESVGRRLPESQTKLHQARLDGAYTPEETQWLVASGFLRMGPWDNAMIKEPEARQIFLDDLLNATGQTFLGLTLRCVKCHDHKFDPIPTRDYYRMYAALSTTQLAERSAPFLKEENQVGFETGRLHVQAMLDHAKEEKHN